MSLRNLYRGSHTAIPVAVFLLGLCMAGAAGMWLQRDIGRDAEADFQRSVARVADEVSQRYRQPIYGLNGAKGVYAAIDWVKRAQFRDYVESRDLPREFPGVRGFGFIQRVMRADLDAFIAAERADEAPQFALRQLAEKDHEDLYIIKFIEPRARNFAAIGLDVGSERLRRDGAERAVQTGEPTLTAAMTLIQDERHSPGALLYVPVFRHGADPTTPEQRQRALVGLLYAPVIAAELLASVSSVEAGLVDFELFDSIEGAPGDKPAVQLVFDSIAHLAGEVGGVSALTRHSRFQATRNVALPGRDLTLRVRSARQFDASISYSSSWLVFAGGVLTSALLALLLRQQASGRLRAEVLAQRMTEQLRQDKERSGDFSKSASDWFWETDAQHRFCYFSENFEQAYGLPPGQLLGKSRKERLEINELNPPDAIEAHIAGLEAHSPFKNFEYRIWIGDGDIRWITVSGVPHFDAHGRFAGYRGTGSIITLRKNIEERLLRQNNMLTAIIENFPGGISLFDADLRLAEHNKQFRRLLDFPDALMEKPDLHFADLIRFNAERGEYGLCDVEKQVADTVARARNFQSHRFERVRPDGTTLEISGMPLPGGGFVSIYIDITERKRAEEKLQLAASVFTHAREAIVITDTDGAIIEVNDSFGRITGYGRDEVIGRNPRLLQSGRQGKEFYAAMWRDLIEKGHWTGEIWNRRKSGQDYAEMLTINVLRDAQGRTKQYVALFSDITSIKEHEQQLENIAHYDALTTLPNRVLLADRLQQAMAQVQRRGQPLAVAFLDLDGFKAINDNHGHDAGDVLLVAVASRMKGVLRESDTLARLGGDEFVAVLLDLANLQSSEPILARLLEAASRPVHVGDLVLKVSASLGVTFYPQGENVDADQLLRQADQAMYQAKLSGKNRYHVFDSERDRSARGRHESLEHIRHALIAGEFVLYYQPKVNMRTGMVLGAEALIRWQHPERGLLPPAVFLPVIEDHPLAVEVGEWVIDTALTQIELWRAAGLNIPVSVNVGARQMQQLDFVKALLKNLAAHPTVRPSDLEIEVLETSALEDVARVSETMRACREIGVRFALDDFGTGYSSLTYLKRLPVALLKIDQSFVRDMLEDPDDLAILQGVLRLASAFRREVIAEGVETMEHGTLLLHLGCEQAQGYGIARPMPAAALPGWAAAWRTYPDWFNLPSVSDDDLPLLFASVEHRAWVRAVEEHLKDERTIPPPLDHHQCNLGKWLNAEGKSRYGAQPAFKAIEPLHGQVHDLVAQMCELHSRGRGLDALGSVGELHGLRDALLEHLKALEKDLLR